MQFVHLFAVEKYQENFQTKCRYIYEEKFVESNMYIKKNRYLPLGGGAGGGENDWSCLECSHQQTFNGKSVTLLKKCFYDKCFPTNLLELFRTNVLQKTFGGLFFQLPRFSPFKFNINYNFYNFTLKFDSNVDVWLRLIMWSISLE